MKIAEVHPLAGMFDLNANYRASLIEIENDVFGHLLRIGAGRRLEAEYTVCLYRDSIQDAWGLLRLKSSIGKRIMQGFAIT